MAERKLQVKRADGWEYVFSRGMPSGKVVTTKTKTKAVGGEGALKYFNTMCGNETFRLEPSKPRKKTKK